MEKIEITIVGAGVIGLAIARELSKSYKDIFVIEKNSSFGQEISSRNSEVIHAGLYYSKDSLKTRTCIEGRHLIYEFCAANSIAHRKTGKLIVAIDDSETKDLENLFKQGQENGVEDLRLISKSEIKEIEPHVEAKAAILSLSTGILNSHDLMKTLALQFTGNGGYIAYNTEVVGVDKVKDGFEVSVKNINDAIFKFSTRIFINAAGLNSDKIASLAGSGKDEYKLKYCKGDYFRANSSKAKSINRLIYPVPKKDRAGLGIHATLDLAGALRFGPDDEYVDKIDYNIDTAKREIFYKSIYKFLPFIQLDDLNPDMAGIRPKLQGPGEDFRDFIIRNETDNGFLGLINLIGIESPGLTSSLSIARIVKDMVRDIF